MRFSFKDFLNQGRFWEVHGFILPKSAASVPDLDLNDPENINLFGYKVHAIMSLGVFTYDGSGVFFPNDGVEQKTAKALSDLLMPGGIVANDNLSCTRRFERILLDQFGFQEVKDDYTSAILQKKV